MNNLTKNEMEWLIGFLNLSKKEWENFLTDKLVKREYKHLVNIINKLKIQYINKEQQQ
jgi:hypothetical protein